MVPRLGTSALVVVLVGTACLPAAASDPSADPGASKIRIVRLSEVKGTVTMDRHLGRGFEPAMANMPIVEKVRLRTDQGVAEVEFEDNSSLRLAPGTVVEFPQLERLATGATASSVNLLRGTLYVSLLKTKENNAFAVLFGKQTLALEPGSHIRLALDEVQAKVAVFDGSAHIDGPGGAEDVSRKRTFTVHLVDQSRTTEKDVANESYDGWDQNAAGYHARTASYSALSSSPYAYGLNDMMYYGSFANTGSCGTMWRPYFASAAWDPYSNGAWAFYEGAGYSWVSPYPWGWMPYHYGSWSFCSGAGWGWQPGGAWNGLSNGLMLMSGAGPARFQPPPGRVPRPGESTLTEVNLKPLVRSEVASPESFVFHRDSAGMGIPREELGKLEKLSQQTVERGTASTRIYLSAPGMAALNGRPTNIAMSQISVHRGSAPAGLSASDQESRGASALSSRSSSAPSASLSRGAVAGPTSSGHSR